MIAMNLGIQKYLGEFTQRFGTGWNRFWFTPSDPVALCTLRLCVGILGTIWFWNLGRDFEFLFGTDGLLTLEKIQLWRGEWGFSIFDWVRTNSDLKLIHWIGTALFAAFAVGLLSRLTNVLCLILTLSVLHRGPMLNTPFEDVLAFVLLYLCLAPTGAALSVDSFWQSSKLKPQSSGASQSLSNLSYCVTLATRLLQIHITLVYVAMVLAKLHVPAWWLGEAAWWLAESPSTRLFSPEQADKLEFVLNAWTHAIVFFEAMFAILIWNTVARPLVLALSVIMWGTLSILTGQVLFSLLVIAMGIAFVSPKWLRSIRDGK